MTLSPDFFIFLKKIIFNCYDVKVYNLDEVYLIINELTFFLLYTFLHFFTLFLIINKFVIYL